MEELLKAFQRQRRAHKDKWIEFHGELDGQHVAIKSYNTWIQVATYRGKRDGGPMDCTVAAMTQWLTKFLAVGCD